MVGNVLNIFMEHDLNILMIFVIKEKMYNFDPYNVLLAITTNIPTCVTYDCFCAPGTHIMLLMCMYVQKKLHKINSL